MHLFRRSSASSSRSGSTALGSATSRPPSLASTHDTHLYKSASSDSGSYRSAISRMSGRSFASARSSLFSIANSRLGSVKSLLGKTSPRDFVTSMERTTHPKRRNTYEYRSISINVSKAILTTRAKEIREVFEYALRITRIALEKAEWILATSKTKSMLSQNTISKVGRYVQSIKRFIHDIIKQQNEWLLAIQSSKSSTVVHLSNWPLTPLSKHGPLQGMHYKSAYDHAAPNVAEYMNEVGHGIEESFQETKRQRITRSTYDFNQAKTKAELDLRLRATQQVIHPSLKPYILASYQKALRHL